MTVLEHIVRLLASSNEAMRRLLLGRRLDEAMRRNSAARLRLQGSLARRRSFVE